MILHATRLGVLLLALGLIACGQKGPLYLPDTTHGEIVTRPATTGTANSPASPDTPTQSASPAPEVTAPEPGKDPAEKDKKNGTQPPK